MIITQKLIGLGYMLSGSNNKNYHFIRALPGAGKHFLAHLLNNHYNGNDITTLYHSKQSNEYFNFWNIVCDPEAETVFPFWDVNHWKFVCVRETNENDIFLSIRHKHHIGPQKSDPSFMWDADKAFFITHEEEDLLFVKKLFFAKNALGDRPVIGWNRSGSWYNPNAIIPFVANHIIVSMEPGWERMFTVKYLLSEWERYLRFLQAHVPWTFPFSPVNLRFFNECLTRGLYQLDSIDHYLMFFEDGFTQFFDEVIDQYNNDIYYEKEQAQYVKRSNITILQYNELFTGKKTNTVFDNFKDELLLYNERNIALVKRAEDFYGPLR